MCSSETDPKLLQNSLILEYFDEGGNIFFAGDTDVSKNFRLLANNMGVDFDEFVFIFIRGHSLSIM